MDTKKMQKPTKTFVIVLSVLLSATVIAVIVTVSVYYTVGGGAKGMGKIQKLGEIVHAKDIGPDGLILNETNPLINFTKEYNFSRPFEINFEVQIFKPGILLSQNVATIGWYILVTKDWKLQFHSESTSISVGIPSDTKFYHYDFKYDGENMRIMNNGRELVKGPIEMRSRYLPLLLGAGMDMGKQKKAFATKFITATLVSMDIHAGVDGKYKYNGSNHKFPNSNGWDSFNHRQPSELEFTLEYS